MTLKLMLSAYALRHPWTWVDDDCPMCVVHGLGSSSMGCSRMQVEWVCT